MSSARRCGPALALSLALVASSCGGAGDEDPAEARLPGTGGPTTTTAPVSAGEVAAAPSAGCRGSPAAGASSGEQTVAVRGDERRYRRDLPPAHDGTTPVPLVVDLHGFSEGAAIHARHTDLSGFGARAGFVTVTPQGQGPVPLWTVDFDGADVRFLTALLDAEEAALCIDTNRIFVTGLSNGAFLASAAACVLEDRIAAVAPVAGIVDLEGCEPDRPVPVVAFHGTDDDFVPYDGGRGSAVDDSGSVPVITAAWAARNGCGTEPTEETVTADVTRLTYGCPAGAETELYRIEGGGHSWPGSEFSALVEGLVGTTTFSIDANEVMWAFFEAHPLPTG